MAKVRTHHAWAPEPGIRHHSEGLYVGTDLFKDRLGSTLMTKALVPLPPSDTVAIAPVLP